MSAFMLSDYALSKLARAALAVAPDLFAGYNDGHKSMTIYGSPTPAEWLATDLFLLNGLAMRARYGEVHDAAEFRYEESRGGHDTDVRLYKSIRCFLYQCSEGDVPEKPLFKLMEQFSADVAGDIIWALPSWDELPWGE